MSIITPGMTGAQVRAELNNNLNTGTSDITTQTVKQNAAFDNNGKAIIFSRVGVGMITHMFFAGALGNWAEYKNCVVTVITDGHTYFQGKLYELAAIHPSYDDGTTLRFSNSIFGKNGVSNGIFLNYKIPYYSSVEVSLQQPEGYFTGQVIWYTVKNSNSINLNIGDITIPYGAYLHCKRNADESIALGNQHTLINSNNNGIVLGVFMFVDPGNNSTAFIEGCVRAFIGGSAIPMILSSGMEDYFLNTYGFQSTFQDENVGVTFLNITSLKFTAYRLHHNDLWAFASGGYVVKIRNGDQPSALFDLESTDNFCAIGGNITIGSQVLTYEW